MQRGFDDAHAGLHFGDQLLRRKIPHSASAVDDAGGADDLVRSVAAHRGDGADVRGARGGVTLEVLPLPPPPSIPYDLSAMFQIEFAPPRRFSCRRGSNGFFSFFSFFSISIFVVVVVVQILVRV